MLVEYIWLDKNNNPRSKTMVIKNNNDLLNLDLQYNDWTRMSFKQQNYEPLIQQTCCAVKVGQGK